jgi:pyridoxal/pyridoxine/pyridoxamine kinase
MFGVLTAASRAGSRELMLTAAQDELISPSTRFTARRIG